MGPSWHCFSMANQARPARPSQNIIDDFNMLTEERPSVRWAYTTRIAELAGCSPEVVNQSLRHTNRRAVLSAPYEFDNCDGMAPHGRWHKAPAPRKQRPPRRRLGGGCI